MKVVLHTAVGPGLAAQMAALAADGLQIAVCSEADDEAFATEIRDAEVLWHLLKPVTADVIAGAPALKLIQKIGTGVNTIDLDAARARSIAVCNLPGTNAPAVAEMTLLLILAALRRLPLLDRATRTGGGWALDAKLQDSFTELGGQTVGLVGWGAVPQKLAPVLQALGCRVLYTARTQRPDTTIAAWRSLPQLLSESDVVSLHAPLNADTARMIDAAAFALMRPGAVLVNTGRGGLVDQTAMLAALTSGHLGAAGLDVFDQEPLLPNDPLLQLDNVVLTPHVAWLTRDTFARSFGLASENCQRLRNGRELLNRVV